MGAASTCEPARAPAFPRYAWRSGGGKRVRHGSRHADVFHRRERGGCRDCDHVSGRGYGVLPLLAWAGSRRSWCAPRVAKCTRSPAWAQLRNWPRRISIVTTSSHRKRLATLPRRKGSRTGYRYPASWRPWFPVWWTRPWSRCVNSAPSPSRKQCSLPRNWRMVSPSMSCEPSRSKPA